MKREDFVSDLAWGRYIEERNWNRKLYKKQGFWCLATIMLFIVLSVILTEIK